MAETYRFGWWCMCGMVIDMELTGDPVAVLERVMAHTVSIVGLHSGEGHDLSASRAEVIEVMEGKYDEMPPAEVPGQLRGDFWRDPLARMQFLGVSSDAT